MGLIFRITSWFSYPENYLNFRAAFIIFTIKLNYSSRNFVLEFFQVFLELFIHFYFYKWK